MKLHGELDALRRADEHYLRVLAELGRDGGPSTDEAECIAEMRQTIAADVKRLRHDRRAAGR